MRKTVGILVVSLLLLSVFVVPSTFAEGAKTWMDKTDYGPEDTVIISGRSAKLLRIWADIGSYVDSDPDAVSYTHLTLPTNREV